RQSAADDGFAEGVQGLQRFVGRCRIARRVGGGQSRPDRLARDHETLMPEKTMQPDRRAQRGFTLLELMITVVVVAILASVAYPSYTDFVVRSKRAEGKAALLDAAQALERHFTNN